VELLARAAKNLMIKKGTKVSREYLSNSPLLAVASFDQRSVYFFSTMHRAECDEPVTIKRTGCGIPSFFFQTTKNACTSAKMKRDNVI